MRAPLDLSRRIRQRLRTLAARASQRVGLPEWPVGAAALSDKFRHPIDVRQRQALVQRYRVLFPEAALRELAAAQRLVHHEFSLLGHNITHGARIAWSRDPVSQRDWDRGFSADIAYRGPSRLGDIKLPWELNKHQYFFTLGKASWLSDDSAFAMEIVRQIDDWIEDNPYLRGINWISALEVGARAISWIMAYPFYADHCGVAFRQRLVESLARHMHFVERHLSVGPAANTHVIGEATALVAGGLFLSGRRGIAWLSKGLAILDAEGERQVTSDGVHVERSVAYHRFFLDHYYLVSAFLNANGRQLPPRTLEQVEKMSGFLMDVLFPDGSAPAFGDGDDARALWFHADCPQDYRSSLALGAVLFERSDFKATASDLSEDVLWLLGTEGVDRFLALPARPPEHTSTAFPEGGYYVMRSGWGACDALLVFDCGPLGHGPAGHGHADALSFQLCVAGYPFFVDAGTFSYNLDYGWRDSFRSTRAHNTVVVDGQNQSIPGDRMSWKSHARTQCRRWVTTRWFDLVDGEHDGYRRFEDPVTHRRVIVFIRSGTWWIWDVLAAAGGHELEALLHVMPDCSATTDEDGSTVSLQSPLGTQLQAKMFVDSSAVAPEIIVGNESERTAWFSSRYGSRTPTQVLRIRHRFSGRATVVTSVGGSSGRTSTLSEHNGSLCIVVGDETGREEMLFYRTDSNWQIEAEGIRFDGDILYRRSIAGPLEALWAGDFRELSVADLIHARSTVPVDSLALDNMRCDVTMSLGSASDLQITGAPGIAVFVNGHPAGSAGIDTSRQARHVAALRA